VSTRISQQQLESYLWGAATLLRGTIDAGDYKQFIFPLLFYKRLSDVFDEETQAALKESGGEVDFAAYPENHRFQIPQDAHWTEVRQAAKNVGKVLQAGMRAIETANPDKLYGIFGDAQWTNKDRLSDAMLRDLIEHFSTLDLTVANLPEDELGQGYEYLIKKFADDAGHTAAEFYTNRTVVHLMTEMLKPQPGESIYDPTCGSGGMLLSCITHLRRQKKEWRNVRLYGQERNLMTSSIARMNCFLHGIEDFQIVRGDTLSEPKFVEGDRLQRFDVILANPPYSIKQWDRDAFASDPWGRNLYGTPPQGRADYAFWQHILVSLSKAGRCAILFPHGVLFRQEESEMRRKLIEADLIECVLGLGPNLFYNSPMEACVVVCRASKPKAHKGRVLFINAVNEVTRERAQSFLTNEHIERIVRSYGKFKDETGFTRIGTLEEIRAKDFSLSIPLYVEPEVPAPTHKDNEAASLTGALATWLESGQEVSKALKDVLPDLVRSETGKQLFTSTDTCELLTCRKGWSRVRFGDVVENVNETVSDPAAVGLERFIGLEHLEPGSLHVQTWGNVSDGTTFTRRCRPGQALFGKRRAYQRKVAVAEFEAVVSSDIYVLAPKDYRLCSELLPFICLSKRFYQYAIETSAGSLSPRTNWSSLAAYEFDLPPLEQQMRMANILAEVVGNLQAQLDLHRQAMSFLEVRGDDLLFCGTSGPGSTWRPSTYAGVTTRITYGFTNPMPSTDGGPWMITAKDVLSGRIAYETARHTSQEAFDTLLTPKSKPKAGDVLLTKDGTIGRVAIIKDDKPICISQSVALIEPDRDEVAPEFLAWSLRSARMQKKLLDDAGGSTIKHIYITKVSATHLKVPPLNQQREIVKELEMMDGAASVIERQIVLTRILLSVVIEKLVGGKLT